MQNSREDHGGPRREKTMAYTVKQVAAMSGVSVRTLHFYDETGLLKPAYLGANGSRARPKGCGYKISICNLRPCLPRKFFQCLDRTNHLIQ